MDAVEEVLKEIAIKHHVLLGKDDPLLMFYTMQDQLQKQALAGHERVLGEFQSEMEALTGRWSLDTTKRAEKVLNAALTSSREMMEQSVSSISAEFASAVGREGKAILGAMDQRLTSARRIAYTNVFAASLSLIAVVFLVLTLKR